MVEAVHDGVKLFIKVVPNASTDQIVGLVGERLKVRVSSPPESGKANNAVCQLLSKALGVKKNAVSIINGNTNPQKTVGVTGVSVENVLNKLGGHVN